MVQYQGYKTKEEAKKVQRKEGGILVYERLSKKTGKPIGIGKDYALTIMATGLDPKQWPYILLWNGR